MIWVVMKEDDQLRFWEKETDQIKRKFYRVAEKSDIHYIGLNGSSEMEDEQKALYNYCMEINHGYHHTRCYNYAYSRKNKEFQKSGKITVKVITKDPIVLILNSSDAVKWQVKATDEQVKLVYLTGNKESEVMANLKDKKIYSSFSHTQKCKSCIISYLDNFSHYKDETENKIKIIEQFGKSATSFQIKDHVREVEVY